MFSYVIGFSEVHIKSIVRNFGVGDILTTVFILSFYMLQIDAVVLLFLCPMAVYAGLLFNIFLHEQSKDIRHLFPKVLYFKFVL